MRTYTCKTIIYARELNNSPHTHTHLTYARVHVYKQHLAIYTICMCAEHAKRADILNTLKAILLRYSSAAYTPILNWSSNNVYSTYIQCNMYIQYRLQYFVVPFWTVWMREKHDTTSAAYYNSMKVFAQVNSLLVQATK